MMGYRNTPHRSVLCFAVFVLLHMFLREKAEAAAAVSLSGHPLPAVRVPENITLSASQSDYALRTYQAAIDRLTSKARTPECKARIEEAYREYHDALAHETSLPFERTFFHSQCKTVVKPNHVPFHYKAEGLPSPPKPRRPPAKRAVGPNGTASVPPSELRIAYVMLVHNSADLTMRIIDSLDDHRRFYLAHSQDANTVAADRAENAAAAPPMAQPVFIIHVDGRADAMVEELKERLGPRLFGGSSTIANNAAYTPPPNVHILGPELRVQGNWGGFSLVNATLNALRYLMTPKPDGPADKTAIDFDMAVLISGQTYPIKDNEYIRSILSRDVNAVYVESKPDPNVPVTEMWHAYVECDGAMHRISRLPPVRGIHLFVGSQWFIVPKHFIAWILTDPLPVSFAATYAPFISVADEHFFSSMARNSPYCEDIINKNFVYLVFGKSENGGNATNEGLQRDDRKCLQPDPDHCGRSPTALTAEFERGVKNSRHLFARKFDPNNPASMAFLEAVEGMRASASAIAIAEVQGRNESEWMFMIRNRKPRGAGGKDLCLALPRTKSRPLVATPCDPQDINQWFDLGECLGASSPAMLPKDSSALGGSSCGLVPKTDAIEGFDSDSAAARETDLHGGSSMAVSYSTSSGSGSKEGGGEDAVSGSAGVASASPLHYCLIQTHRLSAPDEPASTAGRPVCMDIAGETPRPGGSLIGYECTGGWNQQFSFNSDCTVSAALPLAVARTRGDEKQQREEPLCIQLREPIRDDSGKMRPWRELATARCPGAANHSGSDSGVDASPKATIPSTMQFELIREYESVIWPQARAWGITSLSSKKGSDSQYKQGKGTERKRLTPKEEAAARKRAWAEQQVASGRGKVEAPLNPIFLGPRPGEDWGNIGAGGAIRPEL